MGPRGIRWNAIRWRNLFFFFFFAFHWLKRENWEVGGLKGSFVKTQSTAYIYPDFIASIGISHFESNSHCLPIALISFGPIFCVHHEVCHTTLMRFSSPALRPTPI